MVVHSPERALLTFLARAPQLCIGCALVDPLCLPVARTHELPAERRARGSSKRRAIASPEAPPSPKRRARTSVSGEPAAAAAVNGTGEGTPTARPEQRASHPHPLGAFLERVTLPRDAWGWTAVQRSLLAKGQEVFGNDFCSIALMVGDRTCAEVRVEQPGSPGSPRARALKLTRRASLVLIGPAQVRDYLGATVGLHPAESEASEEVKKGKARRKRKTKCVPKPGGLWALCSCSLPWFARDGLDGRCGSGARWACLSPVCGPFFSRSLKAPVARKLSSGDQAMVFDYSPCDHPDRPCDEDCSCIQTNNFCDKFCQCQPLCRHQDACSSGCRRVSDFFFSSFGGLLTVLCRHFDRQK